MDMRQDVKFILIVMIISISGCGPGNGKTDEDAVDAEELDQVDADWDAGDVEEPDRIDANADLDQDRIDVGPDPLDVIPDDVVPDDVVTTDGCLEEPFGEGVLLVGPGEYESINQAVEAASTGDTIAVFGGTYAQQVELDRAVDLVPVCDGFVWITGDCTRDHGIHISASNVTVRGIGVKNVVDSGVLIDSSASNVTIDGMTIQDFNCLDQEEHEYRAGIAAYYSGSGIVLVNNTITRRVELPGTLQGLGNGIWFKSTDETPSGGGHYIAANTIVGGYDSIGGDGEDDVHGVFDRDTTIENNTLYDCWDDGIEVEGGNENVVVRGNHIERCASAIAFAPNLVGPLIIENNTILDCRPGHYGSINAFKIGNGGDGTAYVTDNIIISEGDGFMQSNSGLSTIISRGNTLHVSLYVIETSGAFPGDTSFDEDCMWSTDPERFIKWAGELYGDLEEFQAATGQEPNGIESETCP